MSVFATYGKRGHVRGVDAGVRRVASTFGKKLLQTYSVKAGGTFAVESDAEMSIAHVLDIDPSVVSFKPQPFTVDLDKNRIVTDRAERNQLICRSRSLGFGLIYTPDFQAETRSANCYIALEVKHCDYPPDAAQLFKLEQARAVMESHGIAFQLITVGHANTTPFIENTGLLRRCRDYKHLIPSADVLDEIQAFCQRSGTTVRDVVKQFDLSLHQMLCLIFFGVLGFDLIAAPLRMESEIFPAYGDLSHLEILGRLTHV